MGWSPALQAQEDKAGARDLFFKARDAMQAGQYARAIELYQESHRLYAAPTTGLGLARALTQVGKLLEASSRYGQIVGTQLPAGASPAFVTAVKEAKAEHSALAKRIPKLSVRLAPAGVQALVSVDGTNVPPAERSAFAVDPGHRVVRVSAAGYELYEDTLSVAEGATMDVPVILTPLPGTVPPTVPGPPPPGGPTGPAYPAPSDTGYSGSDSSEGMTPLRLTGLVVGGIGVAGLVVWGVTGIVYLSEESTVDELCDADNRCSEQGGIDAADTAKTVGVVNTVALFAGVGLTALGATFFFLGGGDEQGEAASVAPWLGPGVAGVMMGGRL